MCWFSYMFCQLLLDRWNFTSRLCYSKLVEFCIKNSGFTRKVVKIVLKSVQILRFILAIQFALPPNDSNSFRETFARAHIWCNGFIVMLARKTDNSIVKSSLSPGTRKETFIQGRVHRAPRYLAALLLRYFGGESTVSVFLIVPLFLSRRSFHCWKYQRQRQPFKSRMLI